MTTTSIMAVSGSTSTPSSNSVSPHASSNRRGQVLPGVNGEESTYRQQEGYADPGDGDVGREPGEEE